MKITDKSMAVFAAFFVIAGLTFVWGQGSTPTPTPPAYRGNLAGTPQTQSPTLNTGYQPSVTQAAIMRHNLGDAVGTGSSAYANGYATDQTLTTGDNSFFTPVPGFVVRSSTAVKICLSSTSALVLATGTCYLITGTNYNQLLP